jgi:basic membrane lipoprotein Med (substrate-binding protein (PBP1-ABC) superfamily)
VRRLTAKDHLIGLVGPSGSGKSSVVRAGLIPAVRKAVLLGSDRWLIAQMVPGSRPFAELEAALLRSTIDAPDSLLQQLHSDEAGLLRAVLRILPDDASKLLLVIDQFEELFTLVDDEDVRRRFLTNLVVALDDPHHRVLIVLTLRADFYDRPLRYPEFGIRLGSGVINVVPLSLDEFEAATLEPATRSGVSLEPELLAELLADVVGEPGSLPMFQYTLTELFDRRVGDTLTAATYRSMGGVQGALTRRADDLYDQLDPEQQQVAKQLFLRLVTITEQDEWSRRRVRASEMVSLDVDIVAMQTVIDLFGSHRLLTFDRDQVSGAPTLEVAHEALLSEWGRLRVWIEESRDDLQRHAALATAARDWANAGRDDDYLYTGSRLAEYERWSTATSMKLTASEREYLDAALERRERESTAESERVAHEARLERRARARLWSMVAAVVVLVSVGIGLLIAAFGPEEPSVAVVAGNESIDELLETGLAQAERELGVRTELLTGRFSDAEKQYRDLAETGFDLIFVGREVSGLGWVEDVIAAYPDTAFATMDPLSPVDGALSIYFADEEGAYLAGAAAALTTKTGVVGFVGAAQFELLERWRAGYEAGAWTVNPDIEILSTYISADISGFSDVAGGRAAATQLYQRNADVVLSAAGDSSLGVFEAAWQQSQDTGIHRWAIGPDSDWWLEVADHLRPHVLTSMIKKMDAAMFETIKDFTEGRFEPGVTTLTLSHGAYALSPSGGNLTNGDLETISDLTESVVAGVITLPEVPDGGLMPPPGVEVSEVVSVTLTFDGEQCRYEGPSVLSAGVVEITYHNESAERGWASLLRLDDDKTSQDLRDYAADLSNSDKPLWTSYVWLQQTISAHSSSIPALGTVGPGLHAMVCGTWTPYVPYIGSNVTVEP